MNAAIDELREISLRAFEIAARPAHPLDCAAADLAVADRPISEMLAEGDAVIRIGGREIRLQLIDPPDGANPEAAAVERINKRIATRTKRFSK